MSRFVGRGRELADLNAVLAQGGRSIHPRVWPAAGGQNNPGSALGRLPFLPEVVGSHWAADAQVDVVAINWREKAILLGECKWGVDPVGRSTVRELVDKAPRVVPEESWQVHYVLFARAGFTDAARAKAGAVDARLVDLETLDSDLKRTL